MRFPKKRGQIEVQFNWVFVLIVGALILVFFINITNVQRKNADQTLAFELLSKVDLIMGGALTIPKTGQVFDMPNIDFNVECNRISTLGVSRQFPDRIIFGPDTLKGRKLVIWSQDWTVPYKVTNFLYMTTSNVRYIIVANPNNPDALDFFSKLPENITKEISNLSDIQEKNSYKIRLIFLDQVYPVFANDNLKAVQLPDFMKKMPDNAVTAVYLNIGTDLPDARFAQKKGDHLEFVSNEIRIYKEPMEFGAVFAENDEEFNCSVMKAFKKLHYVSEVYAERENMLWNTYNSPEQTQAECKSPDTRDTSSGNIARIASQALKNIFPDSATENNIITENSYALRSSCAPIY